MTTPYFDDGTVTLWQGDCLGVLREMADASVDAVITDPPYELGFMGRAWDASGIAYDPTVWAECLRVLKPGGHLLAFGGTRTYHRMAVAIEDAGAEIRDTIMWVYGSGFPKSLDVSKAMDKAKRRDFVLAAIDLGLTVPGNNLHDWTKAEHSPGDTWWEKFKAHLSADEWGQVERAVVGQRASGATAGMQQLGPSGIKGGRYDVTTAATPEAARWDGWGTALKPAWEPIVVARKPLAGTVAANVLKHGTGALNIGACRVEPTGESRPRSGEASQDRRYGKGGGDGFAVLPGVRGGDPAGRWPTNLVFTHFASCDEGRSCVLGCPISELDRQTVGARASKPSKTGSAGRDGGDVYGGGNGLVRGGAELQSRADGGSAARFFPTFRYEPKAPASERPKLPDGTAHPTVKPLDLMRWLVRLVTPPGGVVLDPFAGSGTTGEAAAVEGFNAVLIEREREYCELIKSRLSKPLQTGLFGGVE